MLGTEIENIKKISGRRFSLQYIDSIINIENNSSSQVFDNIIEFFKLYFDKHNEWSEKALKNLLFFNYDLYKTKIKKYCKDIKQQKKIRVSSAVKFNLSVNQYHQEDYEIFEYIQNNTVILFNYKHNEIYCFIDNTSEIAIVEFIRDIIIKDQENKGTIILHSAAVEKNGKVYPISGMKGAGKSTAVMELIFNGNFSFFTGDKLFIRNESGQLLVKGWPDYPHLVVGTIKNHQELMDNFPEYDFSNMNVNDKLLLDVSRFYKIKQLKPNNKKLPLAFFIIPSFNTNEKNVFEEDLNFLENIKKLIEYKEDFEMAQWHNLIPKQYNRNQIVNSFMEKIGTIKSYTWAGMFSINKINSHFEHFVNGE